MNIRSNVNEKFPAVFIKEIEPYDLLDNVRLEYKRHSALLKAEDLYLLDIQALFGRILCNQDYKYWPRWCRLRKSQHIKSVNLIVIEGISYNMIKTCIDMLKNDNEGLSIVSSFNSHYSSNISFVDSSLYGIPWFEELFEVPGPFFSDIVRLSKDLSFNFKDVKLKLNDDCKRKLIDLKLSSNRAALIIQKCLNIRGVNKINENYEMEKDEFPRTNLLMTDSEMIKERIPMEKSEEFLDYKRLKVSDCLPVTDSSPLFAVDCEMVDCINENDKYKKLKALAAITVVNEKREVVYKSFVKPKQSIFNYLTRYSGVTADILKDVTTRLEDVQDALIKLIPGDGILVGHSISNDLEALKIIHPYLIDTSVIYNLRNSSNKKDKLKELALVFLNRNIQNNGQCGHDSEEDAIATMDLVKLKLAHEPDFGVWTKKKKKKSMENFVISDSDEQEWGEKEIDNNDDESFATSSVDNDIKSTTSLPIVTDNLVHLRHRENWLELTTFYNKVHLIDYYLRCAECPVIMETKITVNNYDDNDDAVMEEWNQCWYPEEHTQFIKDEDAKRSEGINQPLRDQNNYRHPLNVSIVDCRAATMREEFKESKLSVKFGKRLLTKLIDEFKSVPSDSFCAAMFLDSASSAVTKIEESCKEENDICYGVLYYGINHF